MAHTDAWLCVGALALGGCSLAGLDKLSSGNGPDGGNALDLPDGGGEHDAADGLDDGDDAGARGNSDTRGDASDDAVSEDAYVEPEREDGAVEAGTPAGGGTDAGPLSLFCPAELQVGYCSNFETGTLEQQFSWVERNGTPQGSVDFVPGGTAPGSRMLESRLTGTLVQGARGVLQIPQGRPLSAVEIDFDVNLDDLIVPQGQLVIWAKLQQTASGEHPGISLERHATHETLVVANFDGSDYVLSEFDFALLPRGWGRVSLDIGFGPTGYVRVAHNGMVVSEQQNIAVQSVGVTDTYLQLGLYKIGAGPGVARYDDVNVVETRVP